MWEDMGFLVIQPKTAIIHLKTLAKTALSSNTPSDMLKRLSFWRLSQLNPHTARIAKDELSLAATQFEPIADGLTTLAANDLDGK